jgi:diguanylate cyclase
MLRDLQPEPKSDDQFVVGRDPLTGLLDRLQLLQALDDACSGPGGLVSVAALFIDIDHFKMVNDSLGHEAGDAVLLEVAARLRRCMRATDAVARFGGDEFIVIMQGLTPDGAVEIAERAVAALSEPMTIGMREVALSASIGLAGPDPTIGHPAELLRNADTALYEAKALGRGRAQTFNESIQQRLTRRVALDNELRLALRDGRFEVHYQPQVDLQRGRVVGVEALLRWSHPELGPVSPAEFIPIAEESGLVVPLGRWVISEACKQLAEWKALRARGPISITINLSPLQLSDAGLVEHVAGTLRSTGLAPSSVCLELTESAMMGGTEQMSEVLCKLRSLGVYIGIDDFGTGHSSLARLRDLPVEVLKIDREFVDGLGLESDDNAIVESVMSLAFAMGLHVIAEGVEHPRQAEALLRLGCNTAQGFLFAKPRPPAEIIELCKSKLWRRDSDRGFIEADSTGRGAPNARRAKRGMIDEFMDQIGVYTHAAEGRGSWA